MSRDRRVRDKSVTCLCAALRFRKVFKVEVKCSCRSICSVRASRSLQDLSARQDLPGMVMLSLRERVRTGTEANREARCGRPAGRRGERLHTMETIDLGIILTLKDSHTESRYKLQTT